MKLKYYIFLYSFVLLFSCKDDDGLNECSLIDCAVQTFALAYVDIDGNNLITNGTYPLENITITKDNEQFNLSQFESDEVVYFFASGEDGDNTYSIKLNDTETDELILDLTRVKLDPECCGPFFNINSATYNGDVIEIKENQNSFIERITIVKP
ncbi:MAG: hypothetical protein WBB27_04960 [Maribacter sp.]